MVTRQGNFKAAPQCRTVNGRHYRNGQTLESTKVILGQLDLRLKIGLVTRLEVQQFVQVAAGKEGAFGGGNHDASQASFLLQTLHGLSHGVAIQLVHGVDRTWHVHSQRNDAVGILFVLECVHKRGLACEEILRSGG
ncbi:hypothetical protein D9M68_861880 [compost metagenome]